MQSRLCSSLEPLEARIAPASLGNVAAGNAKVTLSGGTVKIAGDDLAESITIELTGPGELSISGLNGTMIDYNGTQSATVLVEGYTKDLSVALGKGNDVIDLHAATYYGNVTLDGGPGFNTFKLTGNAQFVIPGSLKLLAKELSDTLNINDSGNDLRIGRDLLIALGEGGVTTSAFALQRLLIGGKLTLNGGKGFDQITLNPTGDLGVGGDVTIATGDGLDQVSLHPGGNLTLNGKLTVKAGNANGLQMQPSVASSFYTVGATGEMSVRGLVSASSIDGETFLMFGGTTASIYSGGLAVKGGKGRTNVTLIGAQQTYLGKVTVSSKGAGTFTMKPTGSYFIGGDFSYKGGALTDNFDLEGAGVITGKATVDLGDGAGQALTFSAPDQSFGSVFGDVTLKQGAKTGTSTTTVSGLRAFKKLTITTGASVDTVTLDNLFAFGATSLSLGAGADVLKVETKGATGPSVFGVLKVVLGDGDDTATFGANSANDQVQLNAAGLIDGGIGNDTLSGYDMMGAATNGNTGAVVLKAVETAS